jgi:hypothetical protein
VFEVPLNNDLGVRSNIHGHFETSIRLVQHYFQSVCAYFCPGGHRFRQIGDVTRLQFSLLNGGIPEYIGQCLGAGSKSRDILFEDGEVIVGVRYSSRRKLEGSRALSHITSIMLTRSIRTVTWDNGDVTCEWTSIELQSRTSEIRWAFNAIADQIVIT